MIDAYQEIREMRSKRGDAPDLRTAAFIDAIDKVALSYMRTAGSSPSSRGALPHTPAHSLVGPQHPTPLVRWRAARAGRRWLRGLAEACRTAAARRGPGQLAPGYGGPR